MRRPNVIRAKRLQRKRERHIPPGHGATAEQLEPLLLWRVRKTLDRAEATQEVEAPVGVHSAKPERTPMPAGARPGAASPRVFHGLIEPAQVRIDDGAYAHDRFVGWLVDNCKHNPPCTAAAPKRKCAQAWESIAREAAVGV